MPGSLKLLANVTVLWPKGLNSTYYLDLNHFARQSPAIHGFMHAYALWAGLTLMAIVFLVAYALIWWRRDFRAAAVLALGGVGTLIALGLNQVVGHAAEELRPYATYRHALVLVAKANDYAFPSDHAVVAGALFTAVLLVVRRGAPVGRLSAVGAGTPAPAGRGEGGGGSRPTSSMVVLSSVVLLFGLFLCFARVYVGAHYPGDVVAGFLLGIVVVLVVSLARPVAYWLAELAVRTPLGVLLRRPASAAGGAAPPATADRGRARGR